MKTEYENGKKYYVETVTGIHSENILYYQISMAEKNKVDFVIMPEIRIIENEIFFYYDISGYENVLTGDISFDKFIVILKDIFSLMSEGDRFLLDRELYCMENQYLLYKKDTKKVTLLYIPVKTGTNEFSICEIITSLSAAIRELGPKELEKLKEYIREAQSCDNDINKFLFFLNSTGFENNHIKAHHEKTENTIKPEIEIHNITDTVKPVSMAENVKSSGKKLTFIFILMQLLFLFICYYIKNNNEFTEYSIIISIVLCVADLSFIIFAAKEKGLIVKEEKIEKINKNNYDSSIDNFYDKLVSNAPVDNFNIIESTEKSVEETEILFKKDEKAFAYILKQTDSGDEEIAIKSDKFSIGRNPAVCDLFLEDKSVGRLHCTIFRKEDRFFIKDEQSKNGTFVDGNKIEEESNPLYGNEEIIIGRSVFKFIKI